MLRASLLFAFGKPGHPRKLRSERLYEAICCYGSRGKDALEIGDEILRMLTHCIFFAQGVSRLYACYKTVQLRLRTTEADNAAYRWNSKNVCASFLFRLPMREIERPSVVQAQWKPRLQNKSHPRYRKTVRQLRRRLSGSASYRWKKIFGRRRVQ